MWYNEHMKQIITLLVIVGFILTGCASTQTGSLDQTCAEAGGELREFSNSCVDSCELERNAAAISCAAVLTQGCDCGPDRCWNGNTCENN